MRRSGRYGPGDDIVPERWIEAFLRESEGRGIMVHRERFEGSAHVEHWLVHRRAYQAILNRVVSTSPARKVMGQDALAGLCIGVLSLGRPKHWGARFCARIQAAECTKFHVVYTPDYVALDYLVVMFPRAPAFVDVVIRAYGSWYRSAGSCPRGYEEGVSEVSKALGGKTPRSEY